MQQYVILFYVGMLTLAFSTEIRKYIFSYHSAKKFFNKGRNEIVLSLHRTTNNLSMQNIVISNKLPMIYEASYLLVRSI